MKDLKTTDILNNSKIEKINNFPAIDKFFSILIISDDHKRKLHALDALLEIYTNLKDDVKIDFEVRLLDLFKLVIKNEKFVYVIQHINRIAKNLNKHLQDTILKEIITRYVLFYDVVPEEACFLVDLDYLDPTDPYNRKYRFIKRYKNEVCFNTVKKLAYNDKGYLAIKQNHIIGIKIEKKIEKIPESIGAIESLKFLRIYVTEGVEIPQSIENLSQLNNFKVLSGYPVEIPPKLRRRAQKKLLDRYLQDGVFPDDALQLANLEIIGCDLFNLEKDELYQHDKEWYNMGSVDVWDYKLDKFGNVIEIYIKPWEGRGYLTYFPEELCFFKKLEVLEIKLSGLKVIPEKIINLKSLKRLDITNHGKEITSISKNVRIFLDSIESLRLNFKFTIVP